jgi:glycosyltransferase involved in cell wall biosynthesis
VGVIHNGVRAPGIGGDAASVALAEKFGVADGNRSFVVGTVMRFDNNKRPLLWVEVALAVLARDPAARFVLVGEGPLLDSAKELARRSGRGDSFLFVGRSNCVGYWLDRMSVFLLLSLHESLPNGLIEAQFAGVPVVSTPAGGAAETFIDGETGTLLEDTEQVDVEDAADAAFRWKLDPESAASVAALASETARTRFSMETMAESTMLAYTD